jgi:hypothetical protein
MMRTGEVKERLRPRFDLLVVVELRAVVRSDGLERSLMGAHVEQTLES